MPCILTPLEAHKSLDIRLDNLGPMDSLPTPSLKRTDDRSSVQYIVEEDDTEFCIYEDRKTLRGTARNTHRIIHC